VAETPKVEKPITADKLLDDIDKELNNIRNKSEKYNDNIRRKTSTTEEKNTGKDE